jgi:O-antigen ligase
MPFRGLLFIAVFAISVVGALYNPFIGILAYMAHYCLGPERQWWAAPFATWGLRYSFTLAAATAIGFLIRHRHLRYGPTFLVRHEWLILLFLGVMCFSILVGVPNANTYEDADHPAVKMAKVMFFVLMVSHVVTGLKEFEILLWTLCLGSLVLGLQAYETPPSAFLGSRLETVGGADFGESNFLGAFLATMLPLIGVLFLRSGWVGKALCLVSGVFATNAIVLTRSRGALVGIGAGALFGALLAPRKHRIKVVVGLIVAMTGGWYLTDPGFAGRASTITAPADERDTSAQSRIVLLEASARLLKDHPLGVGVDNFRSVIGRYDPSLANRDAHNTYARCYSELGVPGIAVLAALIINAAATLRRLMKRARNLPQKERDRVVYASYGLTLSLATMLVCGAAITLLYIEFFWWMLALPACLERVVGNLEADLLVPAPNTAAEELGAFKQGRVSVGKRALPARGLETGA